MRNPVAKTTGVPQPGRTSSIANDRSAPVYADAVVAPSAPPSAVPVAVTTAVPPAIPRPPEATAPPPSMANPWLVAAAPVREPPSTELPSAAPTAGAAKSAMGAMTTAAPMVPPATFVMRSALRTSSFRKSP